MLLPALDHCCVGLGPPAPSSVQLAVLVSQVPDGVAPPAPTLKPLMSQYRSAALASCCERKLNATPARSAARRRPLRPFADDMLPVLPPHLNASPELKVS